MNAIANQVIKLSADPDSSIEQLSRVIQSDPALAADVLLLANSPLFGFSSEIQVIRQAITLLGIERIKTIAFTAAMRAFVGAKGGKFVGPCWMHSVASAIIAEEIAPKFRVTREAVYPLALMHDIGRLGLLKSHEKEYTDLLGKRFDNAEQLRAAERALFRVDHAVAGGWLVKTWGYPSIFRQVCEHHHAPFAEDDSQPLLVTKLACRMAEALGFSAVSYPDALAYHHLVDSLPAFLPREKFHSGTDLVAIVEQRLKNFN